MQFLPIIFIYRLTLHQKFGMTAKVASPDNVRSIKTDGSVWEKVCKTVETGSIFRIVQYERLKRESYIVKLPGHQYCIKQTGEVLPEKKRAKTRNQNLRYVRQSMQHGRDMINTNVIDLQKTLWVTFTYADNMQDHKQVRLDFQHFKRDYEKIVGKFKYIMAVEPQLRGAWHMHVFMIFDAIPWIDYNDIIRVWGKGRVEVQRMYGDVNNLGAYVSAYLCNLPMQTEAQMSGAHNLNIVADRNGHLYEKSRRIYMYPSGMNIFRYSRGLKKPIEEYIDISEAEKKASAGTLTFEKFANTEIETEKGVYRNSYYTKYYSMPKTENQG